MIYANKKLWHDHVRDMLITIRMHTLRLNYRGVWSREAKGAYAPHEILNSMFLPLIKKSVGGSIGGR